MNPVVRGVAISMLVLACAACAPEDQSADTHPFVDEYERPAAAALFDLGADGVRAELFDRGDCALIVETVPGYGVLVDEFCAAQAAKASERRPSR